MTFWVINICNSTGANRLAVPRGMWGLVPWPGIRPPPPARAAWSLSHWATREVPFLMIQRYFRYDLPHYESEIVLLKIPLNVKRELKNHRGCASLTTTTPVFWSGFCLFICISFLHDSNCWISIVKTVCTFLRYAWDFIIFHVPPRLSQLSFPVAA